MMAASNAAVSVLTPNGRRQTVKVSPNTSLLQVLEEVCMKHGFNPDDYGLRFQRSVLDLSLQWRYTGLPNNAKLEVVTSTKRQAGTDNTVLIAVQLEDGNRLQGAFRCGQSLWDLLSHFPELRISDEEDAIPTCVYMRDEITGQQTLQKTTLKSLGLTGGNAIIRYMLKKAKKEGDGNSCEAAAMPADGDATESPVHHTSQPVPTQPPGGAVHHTSQPVLPQPPGGAVANDMAEKTSSSPVTMETCSVIPSSDVSAKSCHVQTRKNETSPGLDSQASVRSRNQSREKQKEPEVEKILKAERHPEETPSSSRAGQSSSKTSAHSTFVPFSGGGQCLGSTGTSSMRASSSSSSSSSSLIAGPPEAKKPKSSHEIKKTTCVKASDEQGFRRQDADWDGTLEQVDRKSLVYHMDAGAHEDADQDLPDEFFEVTVDDIRKRFAQLKSQRQLLEEAPLLTQALRDSQVKDKMERYPFVVLRVQFPDRYILQGFFRPLETVTALRQFVKAHLEDPNLSFYLFITPPKAILDDSSTLFQANLFPAAIVYFGSDVKTDCFLRREVLDSRVNAHQADELIAGSISKSSVPSCPSLPSEESCPLPAVPSASPRQPDAAEPHAQAPRPVDPTNMPKWLKLPGKK
ncbi:tether containing UBX domain for GLUT4 isoform X2 [Clupea harengus]|uniref:Tether containing UBX domain for GLUT4 isoform X2 n=1 Tax=Clupea harengus TaxID=7950 RepID=A0A6P8G4C0_CLUHA|nr:tether containing UBX domain for GLUT4 isoform X2 [Clupea harengus]